MTPSSVQIPRLTRVSETLVAFPLSHDTSGPVVAKTSRVMVYGHTPASSISRSVQDLDPRLFSVSFIVLSTINNYEIIILAEIPRGNS